MLQEIPQNSFLPQDDENSEGYLKLFIGGLNYLSMQSDIRAYFETFGKVSSCSLLTDKLTGKSRGFAFVTIEDPDYTLTDKIFTRKHEINGKIVDVKRAMEGEKRAEMLDSTKKIFVGGLEPSVNNEDLREFFSKFGPVREACVLFDNNRGASRCFGFVTFENKETVDLLLRQNNYMIKGKVVDVKQALPKSMQRIQNIKCQSGVDIILKKYKKQEDNNGSNFNNKLNDEEMKMMEVFSSKNYLL